MELVLAGNFSFAHNSVAENQIYISLAESRNKAAGLHDVST